MRDMPVRIVSDGVVTRSVRDTAAFFREAEKVYRWLKLPPIGDITRPGRKRLRVALNTTGLGRGADAEVTELTLKTARLLEELGHTVDRGRRAGAATRSPTTSSSTGRRWRCSCCAPAAGYHGRTFDRTRHDNLTLGLARHATPQPAPHPRRDPAAAAAPRPRRPSSSSSTTWR